MQGTTLTDDSVQVMRNAVKSGIVDTVLYPFGDPFVPSLMTWAESQHIEGASPQTFEAHENPHSQRWQESIYPGIAMAQSDQYWALEIARFMVPMGSVGYVRFLDQVLNDAAGNIFPSNQFYWGSPTFVHPDVDNCRWYLTLDFFDGTQPGRFQLTSAAPFTSSSLPGMPYPDLHEIPGLWYPAHAPRDMLKLIVPGNRMLRFFFFTPPVTNYRWVGSGRLAGYTQSTYNREATENARYL
jgi:hypothetical protein